MIYNVQPLDRYRLFIEFIFSDGKTEVTLYKEDAIILAKGLKKVADELDSLCKNLSKKGEKK